MNPWGICPETLQDAALTLDVWGTPTGSIDGAVELNPASEIDRERARDLVISKLRDLLDPAGRFRSRHSRVVGGAMRPSIPEDALDQPTCVLTLAWDEQGRHFAGPGHGPLGNDRKAPLSVMPIRDLIEWALLALGHDDKANGL